ncbi:MAG TPA: response regulator transcription factor [Candidatus Dormibacteraeota bacterium]|nr:response regulator transcription factor [Candidatus Dormibacteraeota bacterium]
MTVAVEIARAVSQPPRVADLIHVLIVQSHQLIGDALEILVNDQPDMVVVGKVDCSADSVQRLTGLRPDVAIIDFRVDLPSATEIAATMRRASPSTAVVALLRNGAEHAMLNAIEAGATAVISESDGIAKAATTVRRAANGMMLIHSDTISSLLRKRRQREDPTKRLTKRELQILAMLAQGIPSHRIAGLLSISYQTVRTHIRNLSVKLAAHSKLEVVVKAYHLDLVADPDNHRALIADVLNNEF